MSDIDRVLRDVFADRAERVHTISTDPLPGVQRRAGQIRSRRMLATAVPMLLGVAGVAFFAVVGQGGDGSGVKVTPAATESAPSSDSPTPTPSSDSPGPDATSLATPTTGTLVPRTRVEALAWGLAVNPNVISEVTFRPKPQGILKCGLNILGESPAKGEIYAWIECQDYFSEQGQVKGGAGASLPAVIHVVGSGADTAITRVVFPRQSNLAADIRRLFPVELLETVTTGNIQVEGNQAEWPALAERELAGRLTYQLPAPPG